MAMMEIAINESQSNKKKLKTKPEREKNKNLENQIPLLINFTSLLFSWLWHRLLQAQPQQCLKQLWLT